jgi:uncharacterized membrane protein
MDDIALMNAFNFTGEDLEANRQGMLSKMQIRQLRRKSAADSREMLFIVLAVTFLIPLGIFGYLYNRLPWFGLGGQLAALIEGILTLVTIVTIELIFGLRVYQNARIPAEKDIDENEVQTIEGTAALTLFPERESGYAGKLKLGDMQFRLRENQILALQNQTTYRVYYLERTKYIVAIEPSTDNMLRKRKSQSVENAVSSAELYTVEDE